jgi:hypothetical protein
VRANVIRILAFVSLLFTVPITIRAAGEGGLDVVACSAIASPLWSCASTPGATCLAPEAGGCHVGEDEMCDTGDCTTCCPGGGTCGRQECPSQSNTIEVKPVCSAHRSRRYSCGGSLPRHPFPSPANWCTEVYVTDAIRNDHHAVS